MIGRSGFLKRWSSLKTWIAIGKVYCPKKLTLTPLSKPYRNNLKVTATPTAVRLNSTQRLLRSLNLYLN